MKKQKQVNKLLKNISCKRNVYIQYGKIIKIPVAVVIITIICMVTPCTNWLIPVIVKNKTLDEINVDELNL
jgi:hypothetical protein